MMVMLFFEDKISFLTDIYPQQICKTKLS